MGREVQGMQGMRGRHARGMDGERAARAGIPHLVAKTIPTLFRSKNNITSPWPKQSTPYSTFTYLIFNTYSYCTLFMLLNWGFYCFVFSLGRFLLALG
jgi:hypothetical protein